MAISSTRLIIGVWLVMSAASCSAASVGINFASYSPVGFSALASTDVTGVVAQANWNNVLRGDINYAHPSHFLDDAGTPTSTLWQDSTFSAVSSVAAGTPTGNLLHGGSVGGPLILPSPYAAYDLYVYIPAVTPTIGTSVSVHVFGLPFGPLVLLDLSGAAVLTEATATTAGNYVRFAGLTSATVNITAGSSVAIAGLQFVAVPEPASFALGSLAFLMLALAGLRNWVHHRTQRVDVSAFL